MGGFENEVVVLTLADDVESSRYTLHRGDDLVGTLDYRDNGTTVALTRAFTVPTLRGRGYAGEITDRAVAQLEARGDRTVQAVCPYVVAWFQRHPERAAILADAVERRDAKGFV